MSLHEAVLDIAWDMEEKSRDLNVNQGSQYLLAYAAGLKAAVKAVEAVRTGEGPLRTERAMIQEMKKRSQQEEFESSHMTEVVGGPADDTWAPRDSRMPVGAKCSIAGGVYHLGDDNKLYFMPPPASGG